MIKQKEREKLFTEMTTCVNTGCENYLLEFDSGDSEENGAKRCPSCGKRKYTAKIFTGIMTCTNRDCEQFGQELNKDIEECSLCGTKIGRLAIKINPKFVTPAIITSMACSIISSVIYFILKDYYEIYTETERLIFIDITGFLQIAFYIIGIGLMIYYSKSKLAVIVAIISLPAVTLILRSIFSAYI